MVRQQDIARFLSSNAAPTPLEAASIEATIVQLQSQLLELEGRLRAHQSALSLARRLPLETLGEIFCHLVNPPLDRDERTQLLNLCLVCRAWRDAAFLTPRLWSGVTTLEGSLAFKEVAGWLGRAGSFPKSLHFRASDHGQCSLPDSYCRKKTVALAKMLTEGPILDHLHLEYTRPLCFQILHETITAWPSAPELHSRPWGCLRSLSLRFRSDWGESPTPTASSFLHIPASVTSFHLRLPPYDQVFDIATVDLPLHLPPALLQRLTSFSINCDWDGDQVSRALIHCENVEDLTLDLGDEMSIPDRQRMPHAVFPKLKTLRLRSPCMAITSLKAPALNALELQFLEKFERAERIDQLQSNFIGAIHHFIKEHSKCEATFNRLIIRSAACTTQGLKKLLEGLPSITHLTLADIDIVDSRRELLFHHNMPTNFLPRLQRLELLGVVDLWFHGLVDFLKGRRAPVNIGESGAQQPSDSLQELVLTYRRKDLIVEHRHDLHHDVQKLRRDHGMLIHIGPRSYRNIVESTWYPFS